VPKRDATIRHEKRWLIEFTEFNAHILVFNQERITGAGAIWLQEEIDPANLDFSRFVLLALTQDFFLDGELAEVKRALRR
jgi:hypothetical protein